MKIICSFSGGRTSAFMANLLLQNYDRDDLLFVFANTGKENPETLDFINECDKKWKLNVVWLEALVLGFKDKYEKGRLRKIFEYTKDGLIPYLDGNGNEVFEKEYLNPYYFLNQKRQNEIEENIGLPIGFISKNPYLTKKEKIGTNYRIVDYKTASRKGEPFAAVNRKYGIPNKNQPHCTRELKEVVIRKYVNNTCGKNYKMAIGIRADERTRINRKRAEKFKWIYPLVDDFPTTKRMIGDFWKSQSFDLQLDDYLGNCDLCWKKSLKKRMKILHENPKIGDWWESEELKDEYVFDRDGLTVEEIREKAKLKASQISLFDLSKETQCSCFSNVT